MIFAGTRESVEVAGISGGDRLGSGGGSRLEVRGRRQ
jgi:hypothetical protein